MSGLIQKHIEIKDIKDDVVILKSGELRAVLMASSLNFALKSTEEQDAICFRYQEFLNSLDFPIQIMISSRKFIIDPYIEMLEKKIEQQSDKTDDSSISSNDNNKANDNSFDFLDYLGFGVTVTKELLERASDILKSVAGFDLRYTTKYILPIDMQKSVVRSARLLDMGKLDGFVKGLDTVDKVFDVFDVLQNGKDSIKRIDEINDMMASGSYGNEYYYGEVFAFLGNTYRDLTIDPVLFAGELIYGEDSVFAQVGEDVTGVQVVENIEAFRDEGFGAVLGCTWKIITQGQDVLCGDRVGGGGGW